MPSGNDRHRLLLIKPGEVCEAGADHDDPPVINIGGAGFYDYLAAIQRCVNVIHQRRSAELGNDINVNQHRLS